MHPLPPKAKGPLFRTPFSLRRPSSCALPKPEDEGNDQDEERPEDEGKEDDENHILEEWAQQKLTLTKMTKAMGELAKKLVMSTKCLYYFSTRYPSESSPVIWRSRRGFTAASA